MIQIYDKDISYNSENIYHIYISCTDIIPKGLIGNINVKVEAMFVFSNNKGILLKIWNYE